MQIHNWIKRKRKAMEARKAHLKQGLVESKSGKSQIKLEVKVSVDSFDWSHST